MRRLLALLTLCLCALGCTPAASPSAPSQAQLDAQALVKTINDAWQAGADLCMAAEDQGMIAPKTCGKAFMPAYDGIVLAANLVDTWDSASQAKLPCQLRMIISDLEAADHVLTDAKVSIPSQVLTAMSAVDDFVGALCPNIHPNPSVDGVGDGGAE